MKGYFPNDLFSNKFTVYKIFSDHITTEARGRRAENIPDILTKNMTSLLGTSDDQREREQKNNDEINVRVWKEAIPHLMAQLQHSHGRVIY